MREAEARQRELREQEAREERIRRRITEANEEIWRRPAVPVPTRPARRVSSATHGPRGDAAELADALRRLDVKDEQRRADRARELDEDEARRARLMERMVPRRRATVGPGSRRHRTLYDNGVYRWE